MGRLLVREAERETEALRARCCPRLLLAGLPLAFRLVTFGVVLTLSAAAFFLLAEAAVAAFFSAAALVALGVTGVTDRPRPWSADAERDLARDVVDLVVFFFSDPGAFFKPRDTGDAARLIFAVAPSLAEEEEAPFSFLVPAAELEPVPDFFFGRDAD